MKWLSAGMTEAKIFSMEVLRAASAAENQGEQISSGTCGAISRVRGHWQPVGGYAIRFDFSDGHHRIMQFDSSSGWLGPQERPLNKVHAALSMTQVGSDFSRNLWAMGTLLPSKRT